MKELGDQVETLLTSVGVTKERVENWLGHPCGCDGRKAKLNRFSRWVKNATKGVYKNARKALERCLRK